MSGNKEGITEIGKILTELKTNLDLAPRHFEQTLIRMIRNLCQFSDKKINKIIRNA